jgi:hypothetical protein
MNASQIRAYSYIKLPGELLKEKASKQQRNARFHRNYSEISAISAFLYFLFLSFSFSSFPVTLHMRVTDMAYITWL